MTTSRRDGRPVFYRAPRIRQSVKQVEWSMRDALEVRPGSSLYSKYKYYHRDGGWDSAISIYSVISRERRALDLR